MTTRAREALADCEHALADFADGANTVFQRSRWVAVITLLRTVGLVLKDVDRPLADRETQQRIDAAWIQLKATKPEPRIFHDFIDHERAKVVHFYELRAGVNVTIRPGAATFGGMMFGAAGSGPTTFDYFMREGPFKGRDPLDLCREAVEFWRTYLDRLDLKAGQ